MHLTGMDIRDTPPFTELVELDFDARVNVFIGPNASGKSTILRQIDMAFNADSWPETQYPMQWNGYFGLLPIFYKENIISAMGTAGADIIIDRTWEIAWITRILADEDWPKSETTSESMPPIVYIGPVRSGLPELHENIALGEDDMDAGSALSMPFSGTNFKVVNETMNQKAKAMFEEEEQGNWPIGERRAIRIFEVETIAYSCVKTICSEIVTGERPQNYITGLIKGDHFLLSGTNLGEVNIHLGLGINTIDQPSYMAMRFEDRPNYFDGLGEAPLYAGFLSSGTQTTFLWIYWLAYKMLHHYDFAEGWKDKPAILLIDEIENHLHPTWQRRVIPALLEHFPGLQIFATTHSPFVVAGLRSGQVHLLDRNSEGAVTATTTDQDIIGWTTDEILRTFMGVDEPTDELTIRRTKRLRELRRKESRTDEETAELETLRRQVNADILSSRSSLELQDERYADMMMRFIESRQNELSQDGN